MELSDLISRVEGATVGNYDLEEMIAQVLEPERLTHFRTPPPYTVSLDAALALTERVLPGASIIMGLRQTDETLPWARVGPAWMGSDTVAPSPALALVLATLRALEQKGETK